MVTPSDYERYEKARRLLDGGNAAEAYMMYDQLAREGDPNCQVFVGWMVTVRTSPSLRARSADGRRGDA